MIFKRILSRFVLPFQDVDGDKMEVWLKRNQEMFDSGFRHWYAFRNAQIFELMAKAKPSELAEYQGMRRELNILRDEMKRVSGLKKKPQKK